MRKVVLLLFYLFTVQLSAQELPPKMWHKGFVVKNDGDTIRGGLKYDFEENLVQVMGKKSLTTTITSQQLLMFSFYDDFFNRVRRIYSIPYRISGRVKNPVFFEILVEGTMTLMSREYIITKTINNYNTPFYQSVPRAQMGSYEVLTYDYFFLNVEGEILAYEKKKKDLLRIMSKHEDEISKRIRQERIRVDRQVDLVSITNYYNKLESN